MRSETVAVHGGFGGDNETGATAVPIWQTVSYAYKTAQELADIFGGKSPGYIYTRIANPTTAALEAGKDNKAEKLFEMTNADNRSDHFMMEPKEQFAVVKDIRSAGLEMLAIYHSHPETLAGPSAEDIRLALTPDVIYIIVSLQDAKAPVVKGFLLEDGTVTEVPVEILEGQNE